ncbi:cytosolic protein [Candidatus Gracilibacteria bacterium]|nr:cytosolic protein [Candidatus Gracilibacteria bacterium]
MNKEKLHTFIAKEVIEKFNHKRLEALRSLDIIDVLRRKNPYLFQAKSLSTPEEIVRAIIDAFLSSHEETIFGDLLENLSVYVCGEVFGGIKLPKIQQGNPDILFTRDDIIYYVEIKSGPHWGNSSQIAKLRLTFERIRKELLEDKQDLSKYRFVNGCIYGKINSEQVDNENNLRSYAKICGQAFWDLISGSNSFYLDIIDPLTKETEKKEYEYIEEYNSSIIKASLIFSDHFVENNKVNWNKIVKLTSENKQPN